MRPCIVRNSTRAGIIATVVKASTPGGVGRVLGRVVGDAERQRTHLALQEQQRQQVGVPRRDEGQHADGDQPGHRQRQRDPPEDADPGGPVDDRRLLELLGQRHEERPQDDHGDGQREGRLRQRHAPPGVGQLEVAGDQDEQRDDRHGEREEQAEHEHHEERLAEPEVVARQRVGGHHAGDHRDHGGDDGDDRRVQRVAPEASLVEHALVVVEPPRVGQPGRVAGDLLVAAEAAERAVDHRAEREGRDHRGEAVDEGSAAAERPAPGRARPRAVVLVIVRGLSRRLLTGPRRVSRRSTRPW